MFEDSGFEIYETSVRLDCEEEEMKGPDRQMLQMRRSPPRVVCSAGSRGGKALGGIGPSRGEAKDTVIGLKQLCVIDCPFE